MDNPEVRAEVRRIMGYWLQLGAPASGSTRSPSSSRARRRTPKHRDLRFDYLAEMRSFLQWRSGDAVLLAEANVLPEEMQAVLRQRRRRHPHDVQLLGEPAGVPRAGDGRRAAAARGAGGDRAASRSGAVGAVPPQPRRARPGPPDRRAAADRLRARSAPSRRMQLYDRGIRRRLAPMLGDRAQHRARVQPHVLAARHAGAALRRRDRHGRRPVARGAELPSARRCSGPTSRTAASRRRQADASGDRRRAVGLPRA